jgi:hypothetical protein
MTSGREILWAWVVVMGCVSVLLPEPEPTPTAIGTCESGASDVVVDTGESEVSWDESPESECP